MTIRYKYQALEDYLISQQLTVDGQLDDGWGAVFPVKGKEIHASVLFADITSFSSRTINLSSTETLIFVNNFFAWISAEALRNTRGIVDKYIGDELMIVFSREFGSDDPLLEALQAARWMCEHDALSFVPHIGIASGQVTVGYVGTPIKYNCSVFGSPVALAARCASMLPTVDDASIYSSRIVFPESEWQDREFEEVFPPRTYERNEGEEPHYVQVWKLLPAEQVELNNIGSYELRAVAKASHSIPSISAAERAQLSLRILAEQGRYWPS